MSTPESWPEVAALVDRCLALPAPQRAAFLVAQCADDRARLETALDLLLAAGEAEALETPHWVPSILPATSPGGRGGATPEPPERAEGLGSAGDRFRLLSELGHGGMGTVYLAEQLSPVARRVALKIAHAPLGRGGRARLAAERQALARLSHPHIAQILEAGSTAEGHPYFAMELVEGSVITAYCDRERLDLTARIRLFLQVCGAVQHAHQKGILHRDLKPSNVLVAEIEGRPVAKVIDFGIAKAFDPGVDSGEALTAEHHLLGTPPYMGPEVVGEATGSSGLRRPDTRSDVFSLGVLLFELLVGDRPNARRAGESVLEFLLRLGQSTPARLIDRWLEVPVAEREHRALDRQATPRQVERRLGSDLEWVLARALAPDPDERYASVSELAADLERHLDDEPVLAGPPSRLYQLRKLARRHRYALLTVLGIFVILVGAVLARSLEAARANRAAAEALEARDETERVVRFLSGLFTASEPEQHLGRPATAADLLQRGAERLISGELDESPVIRARMLEVVASVQWRRGDPAEALRLAEEAARLREAHPPIGDADRAGSLHLIGTLASEVGDYPRSERLLREALALREAVFGATSDPALDTLINLGAIHEETTRYEEAITFQREVLRRLEVRGEADQLRAALALDNLGVGLRRLRHFAEAEAVLRRALAICETLLPEGHPAIALTWQNLGDLYFEWRRLDEALAAMDTARATYQRVFGGPHRDLARTLNSLGNVHKAAGNWELAEGFYLEATAIYAELGPELIGYPLGNRVLLASNRGDVEQATALAEEFLDRFGADFRDRTWVYEIRCALAANLALRAGADLEAAAAQIEQAPADLGPAGADPWSEASCRVAAARVDAARGAYAAAVSEAERAEQLAANDPGLAWVSGAVRLMRAMEAQAQGDLARALPLAQDGLRVLESTLPAGHSDRLRASELVAELARPIG